jgi:3-isopropylmalate/(R)-2-methylmalate dehydratase large subunit
MDMEPQTLFDKIWQSHFVKEEPGCPAVLYVDLHLIHEVTSPQAFSELRRRGLRVRRPDRTFATMDHSVSTIPAGAVQEDPAAIHQLRTLAENCGKAGISLFEPGSEHHGIVHVIGPELGLTRPGATIVCGDSHTSTHGAFGALAFGIGTSEVAHVLATQCLLQRKPRTMEVRFGGRLRPWVSAKDMCLALTSKIGTGGATGHVIEYRGEAVEQLSVEARMTLCNMSIEAGARAGMVAPDEKAVDWLKGRPYSPRGLAWPDARKRWLALKSDRGANFDSHVRIDGSDIDAMITWGTTPAMAVAVGKPTPRPDDFATESERAAAAKALAYMGLKPGEPLLGRRISTVFIGSCTNGRIEDLRAAASLLRGRSVAPHVRMLVVPGSQQVLRQAEAEGLDGVFKAAGAQWRKPGCSMCIAMNGDQIAEGEYAVSTSNRNFEGRQGKGGRTFLASPLTAAAAAITGKLTHPRELMQEAPCVLNA